MYLQEVCNELNFLGHVRAAFVIVQRIRFLPGEKAVWGMPKRSSDCLPTQRKVIRDTIDELGLGEPSKNDIMVALIEYKMFTSEELAEMEREIVSRSFTQSPELVPDLLSR